MEGRGPGERERPDLRRGRSSVTLASTSTVLTAGARGLARGLARGHSVDCSPVFDDIWRRPGCRAVRRRGVVFRQQAALSFRVRGEGPRTQTNARGNSASRAGKWKWGFNFGNKSAVYPAASRSLTKMFRISQGIRALFASPSSVVRRGVRSTAALLGVVVTTSSPGGTFRPPPGATLLCTWFAPSDPTSDHETPVMPLHHGHYHADRF